MTNVIIFLALILITGESLLLNSYLMTGTLHFTTKLGGENHIPDPKLFWEEAIILAFDFILVCIGRKYTMTRTIGASIPTPINRIYNLIFWMYVFFNLPPIIRYLRHRNRVGK